MVSHVHSTLKKSMGNCVKSWTIGMCELMTLPVISIVLCAQNLSITLKWQDARTRARVNALAAFFVEQHYQLSTQF